MGRNGPLNQPKPRAPVGKGETEGGFLPWSKEKPRKRTHSNESLDSPTRPSIIMVSQHISPKSKGKEKNNFACNSPIGAFRWSPLVRHPRHDADIPTNSFRNSPTKPGRRENRNSAYLVLFVSRAIPGQIQKGRREPGNNHTTQLKPWKARLKSGSNPKGGVSTTGDETEQPLPHNTRNPGMIRFPCKYQQASWFQPWFQSGAKWFSSIQADSIHAAYTPSDYHGRSQ